MRQRAGVILALIVFVCVVASCGPSSASGVTTAASSPVAPVPSSPIAIASPTPATLVWDVPTSASTDSTEAEIRSDLNALPPSPVTAYSPWKYLSVQAVQTSGSWAVLDVREQPRDPTVPTTGAYVFLAHHDAAGWRIVTPDSSGFCSALREAPTDLVGSNPTDYFQGCAGSS